MVGWAGGWACGRVRLGWSVGQGRRGRGGRREEERGGSGVNGTSPLAMRAARPPGSASRNREVVVGAGRVQDRCRSVWSGLVWSGMVWSGRVGLGWDGLGWVGLGWAGLVWVGLGWYGLVLPGIGCVGLGWVGLGWVGLGWLGWVGLGWAGLDWVGLPGLSQVLGLT